MARRQKVKSGQRRSNASALPCGRSGVKLTPAFGSTLSSISRDPFSLQNLRAFEPDTSAGKPGFSRSKLRCRQSLLQIPTRTPSSQCGTLSARGPRHAISCLENTPGSIAGFLERSCRPQSFAQRRSCSGLPRRRTWCCSKDPLSGSRSRSDRSASPRCSTRDAQVRQRQCQQDWKLKNRRQKTTPARAVV